MPGNIKFNQQCEAALQILKCCLTSISTLHLPDLGTLHTDTSLVGFGAILLQDSTGHNGNICPIAYANHKLNGVECNYAISELECLAIVWAVGKFQIYLCGHEFDL